MSAGRPKRCAPAQRKRRQRAIAETVALLPSADDALSNLFAVYDAASNEEHKLGARWYSEALSIAESVADVAGAYERGTSCARYGAGILAALSPQRSWDANVDSAWLYAETGADPLACADQLRKCAALDAGADPVDVLGGRKVRSFFANILRPEHAGAVTIDRHAVAILFGRNLSERETKVLERVGAYQYCAGIYRTAARRLGVLPCELQAVTWLAWRRLKANPAHEERF